jgi:YhcH/YjgK/YiaL family protein
VIHDSIVNLQSYQHLGSRITRGLDWLAALSANTDEGRHDIDGDGELYAIVQSYDTVPADRKKFEAHRAYVDIHFLLSGEEIIYHTPLGGLQAASEYDSEKDYLFFDDPVDAAAMKLIPVHFVIFYPDDGHKPGCMNGAPSRVKKVVIKARTG